MSSYQDTTPVPFARYPTEILHYVFRSLCLHCCNTKCLEDNVDQGADYKTLLALTQTNKLCRFIAMPVLFHYPNAHLTSNYIFNVLNCQPNLAQFARHLDLRISKRYKPCSDVLLQQLVAENITPGPYLRPYTDNTTFIGPDTSLLLMLFSNITRLTVNEAGAYGLMFTSLTLRGTSKRLTNLKYLELSGGFLCPNAPNALLLLLKASPTLNVLVLREDEVSQLPWNDTIQLDMDILRPVLEELVEIDLFGCILDRRHYNTRWVPQLVAAARNLQTFKCICKTSAEWISKEGRRQKPLYNFVDMLKAARGSLRHLTIDFDGTRVRGTSRTTAIAPAEIRQFVQLETLEIDQFCYCKHQLGRENLSDEEWDRTTYLADFLPTTVKNLTIFWKTNPRFYKCLDCILYLGARVVTGGFPKLESLQIDAPIIPNKIFRVQDDEKKENNWSGKLDAIAMELEGQAFRVEKAFEGSGVVTRFRIWYDDSSVWDTRGTFSFLD